MKTYVVAGLLSMGALVAVAEDAVELKPGLICEVFDVGDAIEDFPTIAADKKPAVRRIDKTIDVESTDDVWPGTQLSEHFYVRWTGVIKIEKAGKYTFYTESDDGSRLWINGKQLIDNGGLHAMEEKEGSVELTAGEHEIKVDMFENEGGAGCRVSWSAEGVDKQILPASVLFHKKDKDLDKSE